ncbi:hypothetical protein [Cohnella sp. WQ 127256]|uniref:hypothetical protein n=1 Tax=Cohnella sp. WQ 127256 TaxID=2938790 RepID=UPI0021194B57|nr:hypothetical protein [Cohnella sp. WQ 127256]
METNTAKKRWITLLLTATMSVALLFGATACNDNNKDGTDIIVPDTDPVVPSPTASAPLE